MQKSSRVSADSCWELIGPGRLRAALERGQSLVVGRIRGNDLLIRHRDVSRSHARVTYSAAGLTVQDLGSRNGTWINGQRIEAEHLLHHGDQLRIGNIVFQVTDRQSRAWELESRLVIGGLVLACGLVGFLLGTVAEVLAEPVTPFLTSVDSGQSAKMKGRTPQVKSDQVPLPQATTDEDSEGGFSGSDSAAMIKLMREMQRQNVRFDQPDEVRKIAAEKLRMPPRRLERVLKLAQAIGMRDQLLKGGFQETSPVPAETANSQEVPASGDSDAASAPAAGRQSADPLIASTSADSSIEKEGHEGSSPVLAPAAEPASSAASEERQDEAANSRTAVARLHATQVLATSGQALNPWGCAAVIGVLLLGVSGISLTHRSDIAGSPAVPPLMLAGILGGCLVGLAVPVLAWGLMLQSLLLGVPVLVQVRSQDELVPIGQRWLKLPRAAVDSTEVDTGLDEIQFLAGKGSVTTETRPVEIRHDQSPTGALARRLVLEGLTARASDLHFEPEEGSYAVRCRVDGDLRLQQRVSAAEGRRIVSLFKVLAGMDIAEHRRAQDGQFRVEYHGRTISVRTAAVGVTEGEKLSLRILDAAEDLATLADLGFSRHLQGQVRELATRPHGLFLCCGPTGAGKSTTLRAMLAELDRDRANIITIEDPVECRLPGINQIEINTRAGQTFATALRGILRQDPDVILIGEIRDAETAEIACQAANTGHLVLSTVHANDTLGAIQRVQELGVSSAVLADSLIAVLAQRLVRRLCPHCRIRVVPPPEVVRKLRIDPLRATTFHGPPASNSCEHCGGAGYHGRIGVFELLELEDSVRDALVSGASVEVLRKTARRAGLTTLYESAARLAIKGMTAWEEVERQITSSARDDRTSQFN